MPKAQSPRKNTKNPDLAFEEIVTRLQELVDQLEEGDLPLETAIQVFEEGVRLSNLGAKRLDEAELKVEQLLEQGDRLETKSFQGEPGEQ